VAERAETAAEPQPAPPDPGPVNASWRAQAAPGGGLKGLARRVLCRLLGPELEAQRAFNADQVRLDNALLLYLDERLAATHRHYDALLGAAGQRLDEVDERHAQLARELVAHAQDLARRIDVVLAEAERGRPALEQALRDLRERVHRLEDAAQTLAR
jgi:exonuclease VII small subunit